MGIGTFLVFCDPIACLTIALGELKRRWRAGAWGVKEITNRYRVHYETLP